MIYILYRLFDFRCVYLGKSSRRGRFKIGIARDVKTRWENIDREIRGSKERPIFHARVFFAGQLERSLHRRFASYKVLEKGWGREWFTLPVIARLYVIFQIIVYSYISAALLIFLSAAVTVWTIEKIWH